MRNPSTSPVVVGVTGTPAGLAAVRLAAREAVSRDTQLTVIHAFTWPCPRPPGAGLDYDEARRACSRAVDEAVASAQRSTPGVRVTGQLVDGPPERVLIRLSHTAALVVLGGDDLATTTWLPPSSALVQTVARAWCPVLVARGPRPPSGPVLAAVDGSAGSALVLRLAVAESVRRDAPLVVAHVVREGSARAEEAGRRVLAEAMDAVPENLRSRSLQLTGPPGPALVRASRKARLIVLSPRGARGSGPLGSVAREVLHRSASPSVFVHGRAIPAQRIPSGTAKGRNALAR